MVSVSAMFLDYIKVIRDIDETCDTQTHFNI